MAVCEHSSLRRVAVFDDAAPCRVDRDLPRIGGNVQAWDHTAVEVGEILNIDDVEMPVGLTRVSHATQIDRRTRLLELEHRSENRRMESPMKRFWDQAGIGRFMKPFRPHHERAKDIAL